MSFTSPRVCHSRQHHRRLQGMAGPTRPVQPRQARQFVTVAECLGVTHYSLLATGGARIGGRLRMGGV